jgi:hypothetical protein
MQQMLLDANSLKLDQQNKHIEKLNLELGELRSQLASTTIKNKSIEK